jgi:hypothetical protein
MAGPWAAEGVDVAAVGDGADSGAMTGIDTIKNDFATSLQQEGEHRTKYLKRGQRLIYASVISDASTEINATTATKCHHPIEDDGGWLR